ncbi:MAG TPA: AMP-binding protein [Candidatus Baltobacteraceae bacterium]|nr:AMP-binding protein [Candidatus Baltobacteraceae bacterium]
MPTDPNIALGSSLAARLRDAAALTPQKPFCTFLSRGKDEAITYGELYDRSCAYARFLSGHGVAPGAVVLIILRHSPHLFYSFFGAVLAGAIPSFMPFPTPKQRGDLYWSDHETLFARIEPALIVTYKENRDTALAALPHLRVPIVVEEETALVTPDSREYPGLHAEYDSVACLQHSSGTTGLKKGVMLTHRAIDLQVGAYAESIGLDSNDRVASWLPLYHDMGFITSFLMVVLRGLHVVALDPFEWVMRPGLLLDSIEKYRATLTWLPNFAFAHLANATKPGARWDLSSMRAFISCSEPCKPRAFERFLSRFRDCGVTEQMLAISYAMAENVFGVTQTKLGGAPRTVRGVLSCGEPLPGVRVAVARGENFAENGTVGEIAVTSPFLFSGYYGLADATRSKLRDGWYATGDLGFVDGGELFVTGRLDDMLIVNGRNYYAHDIEEAVSELPGCIPGRAVAITVEDPATGAEGLVVIAEHEDAAEPAMTAVGIKASLLERFGLAVHAVVVLPAGRLVKTTSGKIGRNKNKELYLAGDFAGAETNV